MSSGVSYHHLVAVEFGRHKAAKSNFVCGTWCLTTKLLSNALFIESAIGQDNPIEKYIANHKWYLMAHRAIVMVPQGPFSPA